MDGHALRCPASTSSDQWRDGRLHAGPLVSWPYGSGVASSPAGPVSPGSQPPERLQDPFRVERPAPDRLVLILKPNDGGEFWRHARAYAWLEGFRGAITVDLQQTPMVGSAFAGWLVGLARAISPTRIALRNCSPRVREILAVLHIDLLLDFEPSGAP